MRLAQPLRYRGGPSATPSVGQVVLGRIALACSALHSTPSCRRLTFGTRMPDPPRVLAYGVADAAKAVSVSESTIWRMIRDGELRTFKLRGRTLILHEVLAAYVTAQARESATIS